MADEGHCPASEVMIEDKDITVEKVHVLGLKKTHKDFVCNEIRDVFKSRTFLEVYNNALASRDLLLRKGVFKDVEVVIDTTDGYTCHEDDGVQVIFKVQEFREIVGEARTEMSSTEKPIWKMKVTSPNMFGRGEKLSLAFSQSFANQSVYQPTDFDLTFSKPIQHGHNMLPSRFYMSGSHNKHLCNWSAYHQVCRGLSAGYEFLYKNNYHQVEVLGQWKEMIAADNNECLDVRRQAGHSFKTSLLHTFTVDQTDDPILPTQGGSIKIKEELGLYNGKSAFIKEQLDAKVLQTFMKNLTVELCTDLGTIVPLGNFEDISICDKFFLGGPMSLRGFEFNSIGPCSQKSYLGAYTFWLLGAHVYTPLPFYWNRDDQPAWSKNLKMHLFTNAGNAIRPQSLWTNGIGALTQGFRLSCGFGIAYNFMNAARLELNFCVPLKAQKCDKTCEGLQFGIGISSS